MADFHIYNHRIFFNYALLHKIHKDITRRFEYEYLYNYSTNASHTPHLTNNLQLVYISKDFEK